MAVPTPSAIRATDLEDSALVRRAPNHQFWFQHDAAAGWEVGKIGEKSYLLPVLGILSMTPGVNLVHTRQKGADLNTVWTDAVAAARGKGYEVINPAEPLPADVLPESFAGQSVGFLVSYPCKSLADGKTGQFHCTVWESPRDGLKTAETRFTMDHDRFNKWRLYLMKTGKVGALTDEAIEALDRSATARIDRITSRTNLVADVRKEMLKGPEARKAAFAEAKKNTEAALKSKAVAA